MHLPNFSLTIFQSQLIVQQSVHHPSSPQCASKHAMVFAKRQRVQCHRPTHQSFQVILSCFTLRSITTLSANTVPSTTGNAQPQNPKRQNAGKANDQTMTGIMTDHRAALSPDLSGNVPFLSVRPPPGRSYPAFAMT